MCVALTFLSIFLSIPLSLSFALSCSVSAIRYLTMFGCVDFGFALGSSTDDNDGGGGEGLCANVRNEVLEMELSNVNALIICHCTHGVAVCNMYATHKCTRMILPRENETRRNTFFFAGSFHLVYFSSYLH